MVPASTAQQQAVALVQGWRGVVERVRSAMGAGRHGRAVDLWLGHQGVRPARIDGEVLIIECPTPLFGIQIGHHYEAALCTAASEVWGPIARVQCLVSRDALREHRQRLGETPAAASAGEQAAADAADAANSPDMARHRRRAAFGMGFKMLADFVVGSCNRVAFDAVRRVVDEPSCRMNPLFIHGASGLGKTHLIQGLAMAFRDAHAHSKVIYLTCERFRNEYLTAIEKGTAGINAFRVKLRHADLLLIDDIHFLSRGQAESTKHELFNSLEDLTARGKKVVITSDAHPSDIRYLEERFIQRFSGGLVVPLERPDLQTRRDIVLAKGRSHGSELPAEVVDYIADHISENVRELEGAVNKLVAYAVSFGRTVDLALARQALGDLLGREAGEPRDRLILRAVADHFDLAIDDLLGRGRAGSRSAARHVAMYVLKICSNDTYIAVGQHFGVRSHSTVANACEQAARLRAQDPDLDRFIEDLVRRVRKA
jgi:chromosomal replication initiator protein